MNSRILRTYNSVMKIQKNILLQYYQEVKANYIIFNMNYEQPTIELTYEFKADDDSQLE